MPKQNLRSLVYSLECHLRRIVQHVEVACRVLDDIRVELDITEQATDVAENNSASQSPDES